VCRAGKTCKKQWLINVKRLKKTTKATIDYFQVYLLATDNKPNFNHYQLALRFYIASLSGRISKGEILINLSCNYSSGEQNA